MSNSYIIKFLISILLAIGLSACSPKVNKNFIPNLLKDTYAKEDSFANSIMALTYDETGKHLAIGYESGIIDLWDAKKPHSKLILKAHNERVENFLFSADGHLLISSSSRENCAKVWDIETGNLLFSMENTRGPIARTPNQYVYIIASNSGIRLFDTRKMKFFSEVHKPSGAIIKSMATDAASKRIAIGYSNGVIELWQYIEGNRIPAIQRQITIKPFDSGDWIVGLYFSSNGEFLYSVSFSGHIEQWAVASLKQIRTIHTSLNAITSTIFIRKKDAIFVGGDIEENAVSGGFVEMISLNEEVLERRRVGNNLPLVDFIPSENTLLTATGGYIKAYTIDE